MVEITADLKNATKQPHGNGFVLVGDIYGDSNGRFRNGDNVHTSFVTRELSGDVFVTRNSVYRVLSWADGQPPEFEPANDNEQRNGDWMQTVSGIQFWPLDPRPDEVLIEDIAHALGMQCRYGGHSSIHYSVAQHSVLLSEWVLEQGYGAEVAFQALMHDATEAYCCDIPRPLKKHMAGYDEIEERLRLCICKKFGMSPNWHPIVHDADNRILFDERDQLMTEPPAQWDFEAEPLGIYIVQWSPESATVKFLSQFNELQRYRSREEVAA